MEKIVRHIETLLRRHDYVVIPELGGFAIQHQPASVCAEYIEPPLAVVSFNPLMNASDGLLAIEISRAENITYRQAVQLIGSEVEKTKSLLSAKKTIQCGALGLLTADSENKYIFVPSKNTRFLPANFGLDTLHYSQIQGINAVEERKVIKITLPTPRKIARYAAVGIVALGLFLIAPEVNDARRDGANLNPIEWFGSEQKATNEAEPMQIAEPASRKAFIIAEPATNEKNFYVIVSCLHTEQEAGEICNNFIKAGYTKSTILPSKKVFRIAVDSFKTGEDASVYLNELKKTSPNFVDAWILEN